MDDELTIRQMCDAFDVTPRTLRFYEAKELLAPRREGLRRWFTKRDRARLTMILRGKRYGFSLEEIRQVLDLYADGAGRAAQTERALAIGRERLEALIVQRDEIDAAIEELREQLRAGQGFLEETGQRRAG